MIFKNKFLSVTGLLFSLAKTCQGCLHIYGSASDGFATYVSLTTVDNGEQTCSGTDNAGQSGSGSIGCISGFSLGWHWGEIDGPLAITYTTPWGVFNFDATNTGCTEENCCGGQIPCICNSCNFNAFEYGC